MAKGNEWGQPVTEEALIRYGNEKCHQHRRKQTDIQTHIYTY